MFSLRLWCHNCFIDLSFRLYWNMACNTGIPTGTSAVAFKCVDHFATVLDDFVYVKRL